MESKAPSIYLVYPSCFYYPDWMEKVEMKTSQLLLASFLSRYYPVEYADFEYAIGRPNSVVQIKRFERKVRDLFENCRHNILAISCWTSLSYQATLNISRIWRELYPDRLIVVGGYHASARPDEFLTENNLIDYVICGEGELALKEIADTFATAGRPLATTVIKAPSVREDNFVGYNWDIVDRFMSEHFPNGPGNIYLYLSRGCPFGCSFCMEPLKDRKWRAYTPESAFKELETAIARFKPYGVAFADACFGMRPGWRKEFLRLLADSKPRAWIVIETRPEYIDDEDIELFAQFKTEIQFGVESCSPEMLLLMKKTRQPDKFLERFREVSHKLSARGVLHRANLIFNHPGETRKTLEETYGFIDRELENRNSYLIWAAHGYMHFPGCELDSNKAYYEKNFGSRFLRPEWWKENDDQYYASMQFIPSSDLGEENRGLWEKMMADRREKLKSALAPRAFRFAANKYFLDWKVDPRYEEV